MLTFFSKLWSRGRSVTDGSRRRRPSAGRRRPLARLLATSHCVAPGSQDGFLLIEVMISALLLGLISVATFTGLQAVNASDTNQRFHNEAVLLAVQSQEALRSDPVTALERLVSASYVYSKTIDGTTYKITQGAKELNGSGNPTACTVTEHSSYTAPNFRVTSQVTWNEIKNDHPVEESSIITPPTGSSLEVDVGNAPTPTAGIAGVTAVVTYAALETGTSVKLEGTTGSAGCVLFTGVRSTSAKVEIVEKPNFVTPSGAIKVPTAEVSIAPNLTTHDQVTYNEGGAITAKFTYQGKTEYAGKLVKGDTFIASNDEMLISPELIEGSSQYVEPYESGGEERYAVKTGNYQQEATTAKGARYAHGDLFPFPSSKWYVYAGDCSANNPLTVTSKVVNPGEGTVNAGATTTVEVPLSYVKLEAHKGTEKHPSTELAKEAYPVKITDLSCTEATPTPSTPDNATGVLYTHTQNTTTAGVLENSFQPFGKFEICVKVASGRKDRFEYTNSTVTGSAFTIYPEELNGAEKAKQREEEEKAPREKREAEETAHATQKSQEEAKVKTREKEEATLTSAQASEEAANKTKETAEASERETWKKQVAHTPKELTEAQKTAKEATQTTERTTRHNSEAAKAATRKTEETALHERKKEEESANTARVKAETTTKETRTKEEAAKTTREKEEATEVKEKTERVEKGLAPEVESGTSEC